MKAEPVRKGNASVALYVSLMLLLLSFIYVSTPKRSVRQEEPLGVGGNIEVIQAAIADDGDEQDEEPLGVGGKIEVIQAAIADDGDEQDEEPLGVGGKIEHTKNIVSKQGKETGVSFRALIPFEKLMGRFNPKFPVTIDIPECLKNSGVQPTPSILMSIGRSGSTTIMDLLSNLINSSSPKKNDKWIEFVGQNIFDQKYFFDLTIPVEEKFESISRDINNVGLILKRADARENEVPAQNSANHGEWMIRYLCRLKHERPKELVGFQFKALLYTFVKLEEARESMQVLASLASSAAAVEQEPPIVVIRSRRNTMDVFLSTMRHLEDNDLSGHCAKGDEECLKAFQKEGKQFVDDIEFFYNKVLTMWGQENLIDRMLVELKVPHVPVSYDTLFYPDQISDGEKEWNKMLNYIYPSLQRVSWAEVQNATDFAPTRSSRSHADIIINWEDVYARFQGTEIEHLFRI